MSTSETLSGKELVPISSQPGKREKSDCPHWGVAGNSPPAQSSPVQPRTEKKLKRNRPGLETTRWAKEWEDGRGTSDFVMGRPVDFQSWFDTAVSEVDFVSLQSPSTASFWCGWKRLLPASLLFPLRRIQKPLGRAISTEETLACSIDYYLSQMQLVHAWLLIVNSHCYFWY